MTKVAIFPYDYEFEPFMNFIPLKSDMQIVSIYSLKGWGYVGNNIDNRDKIPLIVKDVYDFSMDDGFEVFIIVNSGYLLNTELLLSIIKKMAKAGKDIIVLRKLNNIERKEVRRICKLYGVNIKIISDDLQAGRIDGDDDADILYEIDTPIVAIVGLGDRTDKCSVQIELVKRLIEDKYNIAWISSREESFLYGGNIIPEFMLDDSISGRLKILRYNHYLKAIEMTQKPELFLVTIPGGIMPDSKKQVGYFGLMAYYILNAVNPDYCIMTLYYSNIDTKYLDELKNIMKYKFNTVVDCFYLSNTAQDPYSLDKLTPVEYISIEESIVTEKTKQSKYAKTPIFGKTDSSLLYSHMIERLVEFDEYKVL